MLTREDLGRCHKSRLPSAHNRDQHCRSRNDRLAASDVADQHTPHWSFLFHIRRDLGDRTLLRRRKLVGQLFEKRRDVLLCARDRMSLALALALHCYREREEEEFVVDQTPLCRRECRIILGIMDVSDGV